MTFTIHQFDASFGLPVSVSQYCTKVEVYCRLTARDFTTGFGNLRKSPNKKVPYVTWADGTVTADSHAIIARLEAEGPTLDAGLSDDDVARSKALSEKIEDVLYNAGVYARFGEPGGWVHQKAEVKKLLPRFLAPLLTGLVRKLVLKECVKHGAGPDRAIYERANTLLAEISADLGERDFWCGDAPRVVDCTLWAMLVHLAYTLAPFSTREALRADARLMAYIQRFADRVELSLPPLS